MTIFDKKFEEDYYKQEFYKKDLSWLKQDFLEDNKENIRSFLTNYYCRQFQHPTKYEKGLEKFSFAKSDPRFPTPERGVISKGYSFANLKEYLIKLFDLDYFKDYNITVVGLFHKLEKEDRERKEQELKELHINIDILNTKNSFFNKEKEFDEGTVFSDGTIILYKKKSFITQRINLEDFIRGNLKK